MDIWPIINLIITVPTIIAFELTWPTGRKPTGLPFSTNASIHTIKKFQVFFGRLLLEADRLHRNIST